MIDLSKDFSGIESVLNELLSKYTKLRFIDYDQSQDNKRVYITSVIKKGFYYKPTRLPKTGTVEEKIKVVPLDSDTTDAMLKATTLELSDDVGNFKRFTYKVFKEPQPPTMEWILTIIPNREDTNPIT